MTIFVLTKAQANLSRRRFLARLGRFLGLALLPTATAGCVSSQTSSDGRPTPQPTREPAVQTSPPAIVQPEQATPQAFMERATIMRQRAIERGDQAFGAVIVKAGRIVGEGVSGVVVAQDPTAHGEIEAIRDACRRLGTRDLSGCILYTTARPCPMCETAAYWARIERVYYGADITDAGPPRYPPC